MLKILLLFSICLQVFMTFGNYIDSRTHTDYKARKRDGKKLELVFSDEFEIPDRSFRKGDDPVFEALFKPDDSNEGLEFCKFALIISFLFFYYSLLPTDDDSEEFVTTKDGYLVIRTKAVKKSYTVWDNYHLKPMTYTKNYTSAMIQTWNKFCFTGGILELSVELPGPANSGGLWPAAWLMGNLARATFPETTTVCYSSRLLFFSVLFPTASLALEL
jgi:beta-glucanase (GH16 family)